jgi:hypothetical protein
MPHSGSPWPFRIRVHLRVAFPFYACIVTPRGGLWNEPSRPAERTAAARRFSAHLLSSFIRQNRPLFFLFSHSPLSRALCLLLSAPPPFSVRRSSLKPRRPVNLLRFFAGLHRAEILRSVPLATAAFTLLRALLRSAVDGTPRRPQARYFIGEPLLQRLRRLRLGLI